MGSCRSPWVTRSRRGGHDVAEGLDERLDRLDGPAEVERVGTLEGPVEGPHERRGDVADVLEVLQAAVADPVGPAERPRP